MNVLVAGSESIDRLPDSAMKELDSLMGRNCAILIGDSRGADAQTQKYLSEKHYGRVTVYFAGAKIRNNAGNWETKKIAGNGAGNGRDSSARRNAAMAEDADCALILWDGLSIAALNTIKEMKNRNRGFCIVLDGTLYDGEKSDVLMNTLTNR
jgi:hypothetical protein